MNLFSLEMDAISLHKSKAGKHIRAFYLRVLSITNITNSEVHYHIRMKMLQQTYHLMFKWYNFVREEYFDFESDYEIQSPDPDH